MLTLTTAVFVGTLVAFVVWLFVDVRRQRGCIEIVDDLTLPSVDDHRWVYVGTPGAPSEGAYIDVDGWRVGISPPNDWSHRWIICVGRFDAIAGRWIDQPHGLNDRRYVRAVLRAGEHRRRRATLDVAKRALASIDEHDLIR